MASVVTARIDEPMLADAARCFGAVRDGFSDVATRCTRFDAASELMSLNANASADVVVSDTLFDVIEAARDAYLETGGRFDPRVLRDLVGLGYDRSFQVGQTGRELTHVPTGRPASAPWLVRLDRATSTVNLGGVPIDLGGIAKSFAIERAANVVAQCADNFIIDAGGDLFVGGHPSGFDHWQIGIEDPTGTSEPIAVVAITDCAVATSSVRLRSWKVGEARVHHLIDPKTGLPGGKGLSQVTVMASRPTVAETWSKVLFLEGIATIAARAATEGLAALWVSTEGHLCCSEQAFGAVVWQR